MGIVDDERKAATLELVAAVEKKAAGHAAVLAAIKRCKEADISVVKIAATIGVHRVTVTGWLEKAEGK